MSTKIFGRIRFSLKTTKESPSPTHPSEMKIGGIYTVCTGEEASYWTTDIIYDNVGHFVWESKDENVPDSLYEIEFLDNKKEFKLIARYPLWNSNLYFEYENGIYFIADLKTKTSVDLETFLVNPSMVEEDFFKNK